MKIMTIAAVLALTGCATTPLTQQQRFQLLQMAVQQRPYILPMPQRMPQNRSFTVTCSSAGTMTNCTGQ